MDKEKIITFAIKELNLKIDSLEDLIQKTEKERQEAPSAMQSWSDTSRFQAGAKVDELKIEKERLVKHLAFLKSLSLENKKNIDFGSLVEIKNLENGKVEFYFVSLFADLELRDDYCVVKFISKDSPLIKQLLGKRTGDKIDFDINFLTKKLEILSIN